jgi:hypothetical protein
MINNRSTQDLSYCPRRGRSNCHRDDRLFLTWVEKWLIGQSGGVPYEGTFIDHRVEGSVSPVRYDAHVWYAGVVVVLSSYAMVFLRRAPRQAAGD